MKSGYLKKLRRESAVKLFEKHIEEHKNSDVLVRRVLEDHNTNNLSDEQVAKLRKKKIEHLEQHLINTKKNIKGW